MKLFKKTRKAEKKWRNTARMIDIHKTKIIIIRSRRPKRAQTSHMPPWIYKRLLDEFGLANAVDPLEDPQRLSLKDSCEDARAKLMQHSGL